MKIKVYTNESYKESNWSGGTTREMAIYPENAKYLDRDFIWRLSSADSDREESSFTKLPDYDRILMVLEGSVVLAHGEERTVKLEPLEQDSFDGAIKTKCFGNLKKDYNLIMRKGCRGTMEVLHVDSNSQKLSFDENISQGECISVGIYCIEGYIVASSCGEQIMVKADEQLVCNFGEGEKPSLSLMGEGKCIFTKIIYTPENFICEDIPSAKATGDDFKTAVKLALGNNRWSAIMRRNGGKQSSYYMDSILEKKMKTLKKYYLTTIAWLVEMAVCFFPVFAGMSLELGCIIAGIVSIAHIFLIGPLIYMFVLPKPIKAHMKKPGELNAMEHTAYLRQNAEDERMDRLMKKYNSTEGEYFVDTDSPLYRFMKRNNDNDEEI